MKPYDLVMDTALKLARNLMYPYLREMDEKAPVLENGQVKVHPVVKTMMKEWGEGGWISSSMPYEAGGQQLPITVHMALQLHICSRQFCSHWFSGLTTGAAHLIFSYDSDELKETYVPQMLAGEWQGTMALTEPQAGSSLSDISYDERIPQIMDITRSKVKKYLSQPAITMAWRTSSI